MVRVLRHNKDKQGFPYEIAEAEKTNSDLPGRACRHQPSNHFKSFSKAIAAGIQQTGHSEQEQESFLSIPARKGIFSLNKKRPSSNRNIPIIKNYQTHRYLYNSIQILPL
ncbi:hypothetical protein D5R40_30025 [Okeania hirsuta]|uniref:Uncharacterized protein n=1 Tax=Okeania hirsuta TaxID=1458930 RepID=A0A3N6NX18_9CYAN|nr:hypothetical protein D5R40_30025 [Okeania hirsuta]